MLRGIQKATSTWLGKAVLGVVMFFLIVSFAIWGIGDIFRGFGQNSVAKIGKTEISIEEFRRYYSDRLQQFGRQLGRSISPDQARALGLDRQILGQLIAETVLDERAKQLRLGLQDSDVANRITSDPNFQGPGNTFDRLRFEQVINQAGYNETRYVTEQRRLMVRRQIAQSIGGEVNVPRTELQAINQYRNEKRAVAYLTLGPAQAGAIPDPTQEQLQSYFDERKALFRAPEYRKITVVSLSPKALAKPDDVAEADAKASYEQRKAEFGKPEQREVRQILFPTEQEAVAAREKIAQGTSFDDIAKERGLSAADTDLGLVAKTAIIDPAIADAAFSLPAGEISQPVKGRFGSAIVTVNKIEAGQQKPFEEVAAQIRTQLAEQRARAQLSDLRDKIEDEKASGATLAEAARKLGLEAITIEAVDRSGRNPDGQPAAGLPRQPDVAGSAFNSDVGVDNEALQLPEGGYLYYDVTGITPSRERSLDEVKDKVTEAWRNDEVATRLKAKAEELLGKIKGGATLEQAASEAGVQVQTATGLQRGKPGGFLPAKLIDAAFRTPKDSAAAVEGEKDTERYVFKVTEVTDPPFDPDSQEVKALTDQLRTAYADDLLGQYIAQLQNEVGVTINQAALNQVVGTGTGG